MTLNKRKGKEKSSESLNWSQAQMMAASCNCTSSFFFPQCWCRVESIRFSPFIEQNSITHAALLCLLILVLDRLESNFGD